MTQKYLSGSLDKRLSNFLNAKEGFPVLPSLSLLTREEPSFVKGQVIMLSHSSLRLQPFKVSYYAVVNNTTRGLGTSQHCEYLMNSPLPKPHDIFHQHQEKQFS